MRNTLSPGMLEYVRLAGRNGFCWYRDPHSEVTVAKKRLIIRNMKLVAMTI